MSYTATSALHLALWEGGGEVEVEAVIRFNVTDGSPATDTDPGWAPMAEVESFRLRKPKTGEWLICPAWVSDAFEGDESLNDWLVTEALEQAEYAAEQKADADREERAIPRAEGRHP